MTASHAEGLHLGVPLNGEGYQIHLKHMNIFDMLLYLISRDDKIKLVCMMRF